VADASYSPGLRTALVLTGAGTAGAYQAGVLRALAEAGVKIDVIAAHGPGVANAVMASVDGAARLGDGVANQMFAVKQHARFRRRAARGATETIDDGVLPAVQAEHGSC
jgi:predicted acylesterase/phospholipase RssA